MAWLAALRVIGMHVMTVLTAAGMLVAAGDLILAQWVRSGALGFFILGMALNVAGIAVYATTLGAENIGVATAVFLGINILAVTAGGVAFFSEHMSGLRAAGPLLLAFAIIFVEAVR